MGSNTDRYACSGAAVFIVSFAVYLLTVAPEVTFWDSGELILGAATLGIPHPPAYPAFCMLGNLATLMPFGNAAYRVNLLSALFCSLSVYILFRLVRGMGRPGPARSPVAASAALIFAFSQPLWSQAVVAEVYAFNSVLLVWLAYLLFRHNSEGGQAHLHASAFVLGLAFANHQSAAFLAPAYVAYYLYAGGVWKDPKRAAVSLFFTLFGYSAMLYLPVRASSGPVINIGHPDTLYWFKWAVKLSDYASTLKGIPAKIAALSGGGAALPAAAGLAVCAALAWALRKRPYILFLVFASASYYVGMKVLTAGFQGIVKWGLLQKFFIPAELFAIPAAAAALYWLLDAVGRGEKKAASRTAALALAVWALLALPAGALYLNWNDTDNSKNFFAFDFATNTLKPVAPGGALFAWGDNGVFPVWYLQDWERYREDVTFIHTEILTHPWYMAEVIGAVRSRYGVDYTPPAGLTKLGVNAAALRAKLEKAAPTYFDYSAARTLGIELTGLKPQGLVHLSGPWKAAPLGGIWDSYVLRGATDDTTNKAFAAEGILSIYGYECGIWAQHAYARGRLREALSAYELMKKLGTGDRYLDIWAQGIKRELEKSEKK